MTAVWIALCAAALAVAVWFWLHQRRLARSARVMQEAIRNRDFAYRLSTRRLFKGERALTKALNQLGEHIREQVNLGEVESWEKLTRVLTHEIMNATAPIASISQMMLTSPTVKGSDMEEGIQAIYNTVGRLNSFVDGYRKYSELQKPVPQDVRLSVAVTDVVNLYPDLQWQCEVSADVVVHTDPNLLRQILINLTVNAVDAHARRMGMACERAGDGRVRLLVSNDGDLIPADARSSIFVPFFTTKRQGNGIGLSLSRRLLAIQGGMMSLLDQPMTGYHTTFLLEFSR